MSGSETPSTEPSSAPAFAVLAGGPGMRTARATLAPRTLTMLISGGLSFAFLLAMMIIPVPYGVQAAGPAVDTLGERNDADLITITGTETYPTSGELMLTTVTTAGGPGFPVTAGYVLNGWLSSSVRVAPIELFFDPTQTREQIDQASQQQMSSSQQNATVAALTELGYDVPAELTIVGADPVSGAEGVVADGDVITSIRVADDEPVAVETFEDLAVVLEATPAGTTVDLGVIRGGEEQTLAVVTGDDGRGGSVLGVFLDPEFEYPFDVAIRIDDIGGPSAGMMFALGIVDLLTPGEMTGGQSIAGTGTVTLGGVVGPIGGIRQKLVGAEDAGAGYFLAPAANCTEVVGHIPDGLQVISVSTLAEATAAVEAIGQGEAEELPGC